MTYSGPRSRCGPGAAEVGDPRAAEQRAIERPPIRDPAHIALELAVVELARRSSPTAHCGPTASDAAASRAYENSACSCGPTQATESSVGDPAGDLDHLVVGHRVERLDRLVGVDVLPEDDGLRRRVARHRVGVLERQHAPPGGVGARPLDLFLATAPRCAARRRSRACACRPRRTSSESRPGRELQDRHVGERVVDRVDASRRARAARGSRRTAASPSSRPAASSTPTAPRARRGARGLDRRPVGHPQVRLVRSRAARPASSARTAAPARSRRWPRSTGSARTARPSRCSRARGRGCRPGTRRRARRPTGGAGRSGSRRARTSAGAPRGRAPAGPADGRRTPRGRSGARRRPTAGRARARSPGSRRRARGRAPRRRSSGARRSRSAGRSPRATTSARHVMWKATRSCDVYALSTAPIVSAVWLTLR